VLHGPANVAYFADAKRLYGPYLALNNAGCFMALGNLDGNIGHTNCHVLPRGVSHFAIPHKALRAVNKGNDSSS
jgi:hypothetical protein